MAALHPAQIPWLLCGALGGYLLVMFSNPARASLRDGLRCLRRYSALWMTFGFFGLADALFQLGLRAYFYRVLPTAERPPFLWMREAWRDPNLWFTGSPESLWYLPSGSILNAARESVLPALENVAGLFNCAFSTFPLAAIAGVLFLVNWQGHHAVLFRALRKRFGPWAWPAYAGLLACALAAISKPLLYAAPELFALRENADAAGVWFRWSPVVEWLAFLFEYLFGVCLQIYLILLAYCWVRGITPGSPHLIDFAIRRFSLVARWAGVVLVLSSAFIHLPLILKNFDTFAGWFLPDPAKVEFRLMCARSLLTVFLLLFATMQITLTFHSETLGKALHDHLCTVARKWWPFGWFLLVAAMHFLLLQMGDRLMLRGLGDGTAAGLAWSLLFPWLLAVASAWLLASWVCLYRHGDAAGTRDEDWIKY